MKNAGQVPLDRIELFGIRGPAIMRALVGHGRSWPLRRFNIDMSQCAQVDCAETARQQSVIGVEMCMCVRRRSSSPANIEYTPESLIDGVLHRARRLFVGRPVWMGRIVFLGCANRHIQIHPSNAVLSCCR